MDSDFGRPKSQQTAAFSCLSCNAAFNTVEELEQHELSCGADAAEHDDQLGDRDEDDTGTA